ncbi:hypothetical protein Plec18170_004011 [Paecilomyces lecythidis]
MEKAQAMKDARPQYASRLEFVQIGDIAQLGVFDKAIDDVDAVIHTASPLRYDTTDSERELVLPAINGVKSILSAASKPGSKVTRLVLTSSFAAVVDISKTPGPEFTYTASHWNPITYEEAIAPGVDPVVAYRGSKKYAELEAWNFVEREKPGFDLVTLCPPMVFGPMVHPVNKVSGINESNSTLWAVATGADPLPPARVPAWIDVRDLAEAHVQALLTPEAGGRRYIPASPEPYSYELAADIIKDNFEWARGRVTTNYQSRKSSPTYRLDGDTVSRELGLEYRSFRGAVVDFVKQVSEDIEGR